MTFVITYIQPEYDTLFSWEGLSNVGTVVNFGGSADGEKGARNIGFAYWGGSSGDDHGGWDTGIFLDREHNNVRIQLGKEMRNNVSKMVLFVDYTKKSE